MKGKIALAVLALGGVMFAVGLYNYPGHDIYFPADPHTVWTSHPGSNLDVIVNQSATGTGGVITYSNQDNEVVLETEFTGTVDIFRIDSKVLYDGILEAKMEAGDGDFVFDADRFSRNHPTMATLHPHMFGLMRESYERHAHVYTNDLMFRAMGGPQGSMDTSPNLALPAPDDD